MTLTRKLDKDLTVAEWMGKLKQPDSLCQRWWYPLSTAALNELPHRASARLFLRVMRDTFFGRSMDSSFGIMTVSLGELYTSQSAEMIKASGGDVRVSSPVLKLHFSEKLARSVEFQDGQHSSADYFISAVPPNALSRILPDALKNNGMEFSNLNQLTGSPIISIHLWYDREVMEEDFIGLIGSPIHWVFNKSRLWIHGKDYGGAIACVISGAYDLIDSPPAKLIELSQRELARYLPGVKKAKLERNRLIKEREATFSCTPEAEKYRVPQETPFNNFFVAGDWTDTGLPATIESAVLSGHRCADLIIKST